MEQCFFPNPYQSLDNRKGFELWYLPYGYIQKHMTNQVVSCIYFDMTDPKKELREDHV